MNLRHAVVSNLGLIKEIVLHGETGDNPPTEATYQS